MNKTITRLPPPKVSCLSLSNGARSPTFGHSATGTGGGIGASQACAVSGNLRALIHAGQLPDDSSSSKPDVGLFVLAAFGAGDEKSKVSLLMPTLRRASFVVRLDSILKQF
jgi:hypothetical protein